MNNVYVAGSINMDIVASAPRHPVVGETVAGTALDYFPGGKGANQAVAAAQMGAHTSMVGRLGDDAFAQSLADFLAEMLVDVTYVSRTSQTPSGTALIVVGQGDNTIVVIPGANGKLLPEDTAPIAIAKGDVLVAQFETPRETTMSFFETGKAAGAITILNPAPAADIDSALLDLCDIVVLNETELKLLNGGEHELTLDEPDAIRRTIEDIRSSSKQTWVLTLGAAGVAAVDDDDSIVVRGHQVQVVDTTGAGDCFVGSLAASLAEGKSLQECIRRSNAAAALCVQAHGAGPSMPARSTVERFMSSV